MPPSNNTDDVRKRKQHPAARRGAGLALAIQGARLAVGYAMQVLLARWMGASAYGTYVYAVSWPVLLATLGSLGLPTAALRFVPQYAEAGAFGHVRGFLRSSRRRILAASVALALGATALVLALGEAAPLAPAPPVAGVWLTPLMALVLLETEALRARHRIGWAYAPPRLLHPLLVTGGAGLLVLYRTPTALGVLGVAAGALMLALFLQRLATRRTLPHVPAVAAPADRRRWLHVAWPLLLTSGFLVLISKTDLFFVGAWLGPREAAYYNAALRTAHAVTVASFAVEAVAAPMVAAAHARADRAAGDRAALQALATRLAHWYFWPTLALAAGIALAAPLILGLFGPDFLRAQPVLYVLLLGLLAHTATGTQRHLLSLTGHERPLARVYGWCALVNIGLNAAGLALFGMIGAALATATTMLVWSVWLRALVIRRLGIRPTMLHAARLLWRRR